MFRHCCQQPEAVVPVINLQMTFWSFSVSHFLRAQRVRNAWHSNPTFCILNACCLIPKQPSAPELTLNWCYACFYNIQLYYVLNLWLFSKYYKTNTINNTPWNFVQGSNSRNDPGVWQVYSDSTRRAEHAHICETSQRVANYEIRAF